jgi:DNA-binding CsgD family transcriptional regulator
MDIISANKNAVDYHLSIFPRVLEFCKPLKNYFGIEHFSYVKVFPDGRYFLLSNDHNFATDYFLKLKLGEVFIKDKIQTNNKYQAFLWPQYPSGKMMDNFANHGYWHGVSFLEENLNYAEVFNLTANKSNSKIIEYYFKYHEYLAIFIEEFSNKFAKDISLHSNIVTASFNQVGKFPVKENNIDYKLPDLENFLKDLKVKGRSFHIDNKLVDITSSELQCLALLAKGYSMKDIARQTLRSHRTVETLLNRVKIKTEISGANSKFQLINLYNQKIKF